MKPMMREQQVESVLLNSLTQSVESPMMPVPIERLLKRSHPFFPAFSVVRAARIRAAEAKAEKVAKVAKVATKQRVS
jgi:hypothetical protein